MGDQCCGLGCPSLFERARSIALVWTGSASIGRCSCSGIRRTQNISTLVPEEQEWLTVSQKSTILLQRVSQESRVSSGRFTRYHMEHDQKNHGLGQISLFFRGLSDIGGHVAAFCSWSETSIGRLHRCTPVDRRHKRRSCLDEIECYTTTAIMIVS